MGGLQAAWSIMSMVTLTPFFAFLFTIVFMASIGKSFGVRRLYVDLLVKIFEVNVGGNNPERTRTLRSCVPRKRHAKGNSIFHPSIVCAWVDVTRQERKSIISCIVSWRLSRP
uniref:Uncharacterized protein n=1 Tax=Anopheles maculatus TaxID=74869 RepID=A0A182SEK2_9DIPT